MHMREDEIDRTMDPGRGAFCATTKNGVPLAMPPEKREPLVHRETNPRGVRHPFKTAQDRMPVDQRSRVQAARKRAR